jgi:3-oxoadipate enol-lactonase
MTLDRRELLLGAAAALGTASLSVAAVPAQASDAAEGAVTTAGARLHYRSEGAGEPLLLIAGFSCDLSIWDALAPLLRDRYRVIRFDNRGIGRSATEAEASSALSIGQMAEDSLAVLDALGIARAHVLGHSMGGQIAQELCLRAGARVATLSLLSSWAVPDARLAWLIRLFGEAAGKLEPELYARLLLPWMFPEAAFDAAPEAMAAVAREAARNPLRPTPACLKAQADAIIAGKTLDRLSHVRVPALVAVASGDMLTPPHLSRQLAAAISGARFVEIKTGGHAFVLDSAQPIADEVAAFLNAHRTGARPG